MARASERVGAYAAAAEPAESAPQQGSMKNMLLMGVLGLVAASVGFAVPQLLSGASSPKAEARESQHKSDNKHDASGTQPAFVPFGELVVNLAEDRLTRYLRVNVTLQVEPADEAVLKQGVDKKKTILKNWLISYLSDKSLDEVRGAAGVNRARREIQDQFNGLLFSDGSEIIRDVLFEEFSVQ